MRNPEQLLYAETHEWAHVEGGPQEKTAVVGITAFAVDQLTDLVFMALPKVGQHLTAGEEFGEVESVKAVSPLYSPVTGDILEVNSSLPDHLETLSQDAYNAGWMIKVKLTDESSLSKLMDLAAYQKQCADEA